MLYLPKIVCSKFYSHIFICIYISFCWSVNLFCGRGAVFFFGCIRLLSPLILFTCFFLSFLLFFLAASLLNYSINRLFFCLIYAAICCWTVKNNKMKGIRRYIIFEKHIFFLMIKIPTGKKFRFDFPTNYYVLFLSRKS